VVIVAAVLAPRIAQPESYHDFADRREWMGIPNFGDVFSNLPFALIGAWGLWFLLRRSPQESGGIFLDSRERRPYVLVATGILLTALGSAHYHWAPDNARLVWDRLPMTIAFMGVVSAMIAERISIRLGLWLLPPLLLIGISSVVQWHLSEMRGDGDLRFYAAVQGYGVLVPLLVLFLPARYTRTSDLAVVAGWYIVAKLLETFDKQIFAASGHFVSGHTLKHLAAAMAAYWLLRMVQKRRPLLEPRRETSPKTEGLPVILPGLDTLPTKKPLP
jgi:hypothetical protein